MDTLSILALTQKCYLYLYIYGLALNSPMPNGGGSLQPFIEVLTVAYVLFSDVVVTNFFRLSGP